MKILIIGRGTIGNALYLSDSIQYATEPDVFDIMSSAEFLAAPNVVCNYDAVINCAALCKCGDASFSDIMLANVNLPMRIQEYCSLNNVVNIHLSTAGVYQQQVSNRGGYVKEEYPVYPHNIYVASKLLMEKSLLQTLDRVSSIIFRLSFFTDETQWKSRVKNWTHVQDTWVSVVSISSLKKAIKSVALSDKGRELCFNIASEDVYLPDYISQWRDDLIVRSDYPADMTSAVLLDTEKAKRWGIL